MFFDKSPRRVQHAMRDKLYAPDPVSLKPIDYLTDEELVTLCGQTLCYDIESYPNYFLIAFKHEESGKVVIFEKFANRPDNFNSAKLVWLLHNFRVYAFNNRHYDDIVMFMSLEDHDTFALKRATDMIILDEEIRQSDIEQEFGFTVKESNRIDIMEVAPGPKISLKKYAGRLHMQKLQDLPYDPNTVLTDEEIDNVRAYCVNDLDNTIGLWNAISKELKLRYELSEKYGIDLRSKSDAQIAEAVICSEIKKVTGKWPNKPTVASGSVFNYDAPHYLKFQTPMMQQVLKNAINANYIISDGGKVLLPEILTERKIQIGDTFYSMGIGGLHSNEKSAAHIADENTIIVDRDVASYYPAIILNNGLCPPHLGDTFLKVYKDIVNTRLEAKRSGNKVVADSLKITINGSFGKFGSKYSRLYAPNLLIQTTITGQLSLLLLIERLELVGIKVVSANTDGIVIKCPQGRYDELNWYIQEWEMVTGFVTEETRYKALYSRDVNNYIAIKEKGYKGKGAYGEPTLMKDPKIKACVDAVIAKLMGEGEIENVINGRQDVRDFCLIQSVAGGAEKDGHYLGKMVRWYYRKNEYGTINYKTSGNLVGGSSGGWPLMDLPTDYACPDDLDRARYIQIAYEMLDDIGYNSATRQESLF